MKEGTRIYYTGDIANDDGTGTITEIKETKWGTDIIIKMDDSRDITVSPCNFSDEYKGNGSTRFVTLEAYNTYRKMVYKKHYNLDVPDTKVINHNISLVVTITK